MDLPEDELVLNRLPDDESLTAAPLPQKEREATQSPKNPQSPKALGLKLHRLPTQDTLKAPPVTAEDEPSQWDYLQAHIAQVELKKVESWKTRPAKATRHARVALLQWELDGSYRHPIMEGCNESAASMKEFKRTPHSFNSPDSIKSCSEHRRRALLAATFRACQAFNVDILLLPEYSIRPETAKWLWEVLPELAPETSVWAGTYRQPPQMSSILPDDVEIPPDWSAMMPIILADTGAISERSLKSRTKKYPSVAANEVFYPHNNALEPQFVPGLPQFDPRSYVFELICSEAFLMTSPANLLGIVHAFANLLTRFGINSPARSGDELQNHLLQDIKAFAKATSLSAAEDITPRSLLLISAMTSRSVDYSILGQAGFLASGITTVFCNAVTNTYGNGGSCIVGHDGWGKEEKEIPGIPEPGPYHGVRPGIFHPKRYNSGALGKEEQASLIADIDPVYSLEGKPRPQMLPLPLSLVAHLPILESDTIKEGAEGCSCQRRGKKEARLAEIRDFICSLQALNKTSSVHTTVQDPSPSTTIELLKKLENLIENHGKTKSSWLKERRKGYEKDYCSNPQPWPPPVVLDWLWVDLSKPPEGFPDIEAPAYSEAPNVPN